MAGVDVGGVGRWRDVTVIVTISRSSQIVTKLVAQKLGAS